MGLSSRTSFETLSGLDSNLRERIIGFTDISIHQLQADAEVQAFDNFLLMRVRGVGRLQIQQYRKAK